MAHFLNKNTGQHITHEDEDLVELFRWWARWEETAEAPKKVLTAAQKKAAAKAEADAKAKADAETKAKAEADAKE